MNILFFVLCEQFIYYIHGNKKKLKKKTLLFEPVCLESNNKKIKCIINFNLRISTPHNLVVNSRGE